MKKRLERSTSKAIGFFVMLGVLSVAVVLGASSFTATLETPVAAALSTTPNLAAHFTLDETTGTSVADSIGGPAGTLVNAPTSTTGKVNGGAARSFNGTNQYISVPDSPALQSPTTEISVAAWVYSKRNTTTETILEKPNSSGWGSYELSMDGNGIYFVVESLATGSYHYWKTTSRPSLNAWHHIAATWKKGTNPSTDAQVFVDGIAQTLMPLCPFVSAGTPCTPSQHAVTSIGYASQPLSIGRMNSTPGYYLYGSIDDVRIYNRALSSLEVGALFTGTSTPTPCPTTNDWTCTAYSACPATGGTQSRVCSLPRPDCAPSAPKPAETLNCAPPTDTTSPTDVVAVHSPKGDPLPSTNTLSNEPISIAASAKDDHLASIDIWVDGVKKVCTPIALPAISPCSVAQQYKDGPHTYYAMATDAAGNAPTKSAEGSFVVEAGAEAPSPSSRVVVDESGHGNDMKLKGTVSVVPEDFLDFGKVFKLTGKDSYLEIPDNDLWNFESGDFTIGMWVNFTTVNDGAAGTFLQNVIMAQDEGAGDKKKWIFAYGKDLLGKKALVLNVNNPGVGSLTNWASVNIAPGAWHYLSVVRKGSALAFYDNLKPVAASGTDQITFAMPDVNAPVTVGYAAESGQYLTAAISPGANKSLLGMIQGFFAPKNVNAGTTDGTTTTGFTGKVGPGSIGNCSNDGFKDAQSDIPDDPGIGPVHQYASVGPGGIAKDTAGGRDLRDYDQKGGVVPGHDSMVFTGVGFIKSDPVQHMIAPIGGSVVMLAKVNVLPGSYTTYLTISASSANNTQSYVGIHQEDRPYVLDNRTFVRDGVTVTTPSHIYISDDVIKNHPAYFMYESAYLPSLRVEVIYSDANSLPAKVRLKYPAGDVEKDIVRRIVVFRKPYGGNCSLDPAECKVGYSGDSFYELPLAVPVIVPVDLTRPPEFPTEYDLTVGGLGEITGLTVYDGASPDDINKLKERASVGL